MPPRAQALSEAATSAGSIDRRYCTELRIWDGRPDRVHFFELRLDQLPELRLDNREIVAARLVSPEELPGMALTGPVTAYLGGLPSAGCHRSLA